MSHHAVRILSRVLFLIAAMTGLIGAHRYIFGAFPKAPLIRDLPWGAITASECFAVTLLLVIAAAWLGRRSLTAPEPAAPGAQSRVGGATEAVLGEGAAHVALQAKAGSRTRAT